jgi:multidrug efflux pump subunit AcrA (membrane-fusion protein)
MATKNQSILHKPKVILPIVALLALVAGVISFRYVGTTPDVSLPNVSGVTTTTETLADTVDLAFPKIGRVESVSVKVGDTVTKGEILAALDAKDALGAVNQAKGALELAKAQYASLNVQYENARKEQDTLVENAHRTLLSNNLEATADTQNAGPAPTISGTYTCSTEGEYHLKLYASGGSTGYAFTLTGLEKGSGLVSITTPQALGDCGLFIEFKEGFSAFTNWTVSIPNTRSSSYVQNKNAYDLSQVKRKQVLSQLEANLGENNSDAANVAKAAVTSAEGTYQAAVGAYQNNLIVAPFDGVVTLIDSHLKVGQSVSANKTVISLKRQ